MLKYFKKVKDNISIIIIVAILLISTFLIGTPINEGNIRLVLIISGVFSICYYIFKREKIIQDKVDICVAFLCISTLIPLIFNTYVSLSGTLYSIMKYFCILNMFLITKHECKKNPKYIHIILNTIIISILILCIIGLEELGGNYLNDFKKTIGYRNLGLKDGRIGSLFAYANAMAVVAGAGIFLCIGYIFSIKNIKAKLLYVAISAVMLITMVLTYSRLVLLLFVVLSIIYILILFKKYKIREKINKKLIIGSAIILALCIIYIVVGLLITGKLNVNGTYQKKLFNMQANKDYIFTFDINSVSDVEDNFVIQIIENNIYLDEVNTTEFEFDNYLGKKDITIHTKDSTTAIFILIKNKEKIGTLEINSLNINGEEEVISYKLLPTNLVFKIQEISLNQKSVWQRAVFIRDALKEIKDNWLFGMGGNAWRTVQLRNQEYSYYAKEAHSFATQIFLENGIVGFLGYLGIIVYLIKTIYKEVKKRDINLIKISSIVAILCIVIHSILDFDMSFFYVMLIIILILATMEDKQEVKQKANIAQWVLNIVLIIIAIGTIYISVIENHYDEHKSAIRVNSKRTEADFYDEYYRFLPFNTEINIKKYRALTKEENVSNNKEIKETLENIIKFEKYNDMNLSLESIYNYIKLSLELGEDMEACLNFALEYVYDTEQFNRYKPAPQLARLNNLKRIVELLYENNNDEFANKFNEQLMKEISEKEQCILDYEKGRYPKEAVVEYARYILELKMCN